MKQIEERRDEYVQSALEMEMGCVRVGAEDDPESEEQVSEKDRRLHGTLRNFVSSVRASTSPSTLVGVY